MVNKPIKPPAQSTSFSDSGRSAKNRFENIFNTKAKKTGILSFIIIVAIIGIVGTMVAFNGTQHLYENERLGIRLEFPASWEGKYDIEEEQNSITVYHKDIWVKYGEGTGKLFYIERLAGTLSQEQIADPGNRFMILQANGYTYVFGRPTDVQYPIWEGGDKVLADDYVKLSESLDKIKKSIKPIAVNISVVPSNINKLYHLKDTYVSDNSKVYNIISSANFADISIKSIALKTDSKPYTVTINYKVDTRSKFRFFDYSAFNKTTAMMFCLIPNVDEVYFRIYDDYGDVDTPETAFLSAYFNRGNLSERGGMGYFIDDNVRNATGSMERFTDYFYKVTAVNNETFYNNEFKGNSSLTQIYNIIGDENEIVVNSGMQNFITVTKELAKSQRLRALVEPKNIKLEEYIGKKIEFLTYGIRNFTTNQDTSYLFVFDGEKLIAYENLNDSQMDKTVMDVIRTFADK